MWICFAYVMNDIDIYNGNLNSNSDDNSNGIKKLGSIPITK